MRNFLKNFVLTILVTGMLILSTSCERQQIIEESIKTETTNPFLLEPQDGNEQVITTALPVVTETGLLPTIEPQRAKYALDLFYDHNSRVLSVDESVTYFNKTSLDLDTIPFILPFKSVHEFNLGEINTNQESQPLVEINENSLFLILHKPLMMGESVTISFSYEISIPESGGTLGWTNRQINLADFYPMIPAFSVGDGWIMNEPWTVGEYLVYELSDFDLEFSTNVNDDFQIFSNAPGKTSEHVYTINEEKYRNIVISLCNGCTRIESDYEGFKVIGSFNNQDENIGQASVGIIAEALVFFSELFGVEYPHSEMTIIEADFPDGMEYDGLFFLSKDWFDQYNGTFKNYLSLLTVHETSHQWWFGLVANNQATEPWLDEALATYSEYLFLEEFYPELSVWWWDYRIYSFNPTGNIGSDIYEFDRARPYINAVYLRGAAFLHGLRTLLTDEVFFLRLRQYAQNFQGLISTAEGFKNIFIPEMTPDEADLLKKFFDQ